MGRAGSGHSRRAIGAGQARAALVVQLHAFQPLVERLHRLCLPAPGLLAGHNQSPQGILPHQVLCL